MPTDSSAITIRSPPAAGNSESSDDGGSAIGSHRTLVITLSTVLSVLGLALIVGTVLICLRKRRRRLPFLPRGVSPIDDDEIERWRSPRDDEKARFQAGDTDADAEADAGFNKETGGSSHAKHPSTSSVKKPPSVIIYSRPYDPQPPRHSTDAESRRSFAQNHPAFGGKASFDKSLPQTPILARAPNSRAGLTDATVPGDEPFIATPKRTPSRRLSKPPPNSSNARRSYHARARSSRSSTRSFGESYSGSGGIGVGIGSGGVGAGVGIGVGGGGGCDRRSRACSDAELSPRCSHDHQHLARHSSQHSRSYPATPRGSHSRVYSSSSIPPRQSFGDEVWLGGASPARPGFPDDTEGIGRAIG
ncbi:hypothetical protein VTH82DRAFT_2880 [Thermothelomyces myriococcoides]